MNKASAAKNLEVSRTFLGATRLHEVESYVIVVAFTSPPLLVADWPFFSITLIYTNGPFKVAPARWSISDGP